MIVTSIKAHISQRGKYSVFIDGEYVFSLSDSALLESKLVRGQDLDEKQIEAFKQRSADDLLFEQTIRYVSLRLRTAWEVKSYLSRKGASPALITSILNKLSDIHLIDDEKYVRAYINDRQLFRPTSRRKIILELQKKHIDGEVIKDAAAAVLEQNEEQTALQAIIRRLRKQSRYQNDLKLMQYLSRQGFNYGDIKAALSNEKLDA